MTKKEKPFCGQGITTERLKNGETAKSTVFNSIPSCGVVNQVPCGSLQGLLAPLLLVGAENAMSTSEITRITGWSEREVRQKTNIDRQGGIMICCRAGKHPGLFLPDTGEKGTQELMTTYQLNYSKAVSLLSAVRCIREELIRRGALHRTQEKQIDGQIRLEECK